MRRRALADLLGNLSCRDFRHHDLRSLADALRRCLVDEQRRQDRACLGGLAGLERRQSKQLTRTVPPRAFLGHQRREPILHLGKVGLADAQAGRLEARELAQHLVGGAVVGQSLVSRDRIGLLALLALRACELQLRQGAIAAGAVHSDLLEFLLGAAVLLFVDEEQRLFIARASILRGGKAVAFPKLEAEHAEHDHGGASDDVGAVLLPDLLEAFAPQLFFDFAEKTVVLLCHRDFSP